MKIDLNKTYRTRDGRAVVGLHLRPEHDPGSDRATYPYRATIEGTGSQTYTSEGRFLAFAGDEPEDLIPLEDEPAATPSYAFGIDPSQVLAGAEGFQAVAIVGVEADGNLVVSSSTGTPLTLALLKQGIFTVERLAAA